MSTASDSGSVFTPGTRVRLTSTVLRAVTRPGHLGTVTAVEDRLPWPVSVRFDGRRTDTPCSAAELEPLP